MGQPVLELNNSANWDLVWSTTVEAVKITNPPGRYYPIPKVICPTLLDTHIIAVLATSVSASPHWRFAGYLNQKIQTGITGGGVTDTEVVSARRMFLKRISLIIFPKLTNTYSLSFDIPYWFEDISLFLWSYSGTATDSTENMIDNLQTDIQRIESKIDGLINES
jgi:hypothetical protein